MEKTPELHGLSDEEASAACTDPEPGTKDFMMHQTMLRIKDPRKSLPFYTKCLGMTLLRKIDVLSRKVSLYLMGYEDKKDIPEDYNEWKSWMRSRKATLELTHNWGTENDEKTYHNGNSDPRGFGHIGIMVPDISAACKRFEELGVTFVKKLDSEIKGVAFIQDPDGYWVEILGPDIGSVL